MRSGECPVCRKTKHAKEKYDDAVSRATQKYNSVVNDAWEKKEAAMEEANSITETVPYSRRPGR
jgi:hypothetical protein